MIKSDQDKIKRESKQLGVFLGLVSVDDGGPPSMQGATFKVGLQYCSNLIDGVAGWASACISSIPAYPAMQGPVWGSAGVFTIITVTTFLLARQKAEACPEELDTDWLPWPRCGRTSRFPGKDRTLDQPTSAQLSSLIMPHYIRP